MDSKYKLILVTLVLFLSISFINSTPYSDCTVYGNCKPLISGTGGNITNNYYNNTYVNGTGGGNSSFNQSLTDTLYYPLNTNPAGYLTTESDPVFNNWLGNPNKNLAVNYLYASGGLLDAVAGTGNLSVGPVERCLYNLTGSCVLNWTDGVNLGAGSMDYTNIAMTNQTNTFTQNQQFQGNITNSVNTTRGMVITPSGCIVIGNLSLVSLC